MSQRLKYTPPQEVLEETESKMVLKSERPVCVYMNGSYMYIAAQTNTQIQKLSEQFKSMEEYLKEDRALVIPHATTNNPIGKITIGDIDETENYLPFFAKAKETTPEFGSIEITIKETYESMREYLRENVTLLSAMGIKILE